MLAVNWNRQTDCISNIFIRNTCIKQTYIQVDLFLCQAARMSPLFSFVAVVIVKAVPFPIVWWLRIDEQANLFVC